MIPIPEKFFSIPPSYGANIPPSLLDLFACGVAIFAPNYGRPFYVNKSFCEMTGYDSNENATETHWLEGLIHPEERGLLRSHMERQIAGQDFGELECRLTEYNGGVIWVQCRVTPFKSEEHGDCCILFLTDITKAKLASIRAQREHLALTDAIPGGVAKVLINENFKIETASDGFYRMTGYTREEYNAPPIGACGSRIVVPEDLPGLISTVGEQVSADQFIYAEYRIIKKDSSVAQISVYGQKIGQENGCIIVEAVFIDTTTAKNTEHKLRNLINSVPGGVGHVRLAGGQVNFDYGSTGLSRLTGFTLEEYQNGVRHQQDNSLQTLYEEMSQVVSMGEQALEFDYKMMRRDNRERWMHVSGVRAEDNALGEPCFECIFIDITDQKNARQQMELNEARYHIIFEQTQDVIFEWDLCTNAIYHSPSFETKFGYEIPAEDSLRFIQEHVISPEDRPTLIDINTRLLAGEPYVEAQYRIRTAAFEYLWCRIKSTLVCNEYGKPVRAVGMISDVDQYVQETARLKEQAQKDLLTGLYNKITVQNKIDEFLKGEGSQATHALYLIDIDDFKSINDCFGHLVGDTILSQISSRIQEQSGECDLVGRVGGDEFILLYKNVPGPEEAESKAQLLCDIFCLCLRGVKSDYQISGSVGYAIFPTQGKRFLSLFEKADTALYLAKRRGKNQFCQYDERAESADTGTMRRTHTDIESASDLQDNFVHYMFSILHSSHDLFAAIQTVLELSARNYHLGHIYIFENITTCGRMQKTFESYVGEPPKDDHNLLPLIKDHKDYFTQCSENGVFYCNNISSLPPQLAQQLSALGIHCVLHVPILDNFAYRGVIGFSESSPERKWSQSEIDDFTLLAKILSTFLTKHGAQQNTLSSDPARLILDHLKIRSYIIEKNGTIVYLNRDAQEQGAHVRVDTKCYQSLRHRQELCPDCPVKLVPPGGSYTFESHNKVFDTWEEITATEINWLDGSQKYLVTCRTITK